MRRHAFSLVELLIVMSIIAVFAALVVPNLTRALGSGRTESMSSTIHTVRSLIGFYSTADDPLTTVGASGFPDQVHPHWFASGKLPKHQWTEQTMVIETVTAGADAVYPAAKTFDPAVADDPNAWYNADNGAFCVRIVAEATNAETLAVFNEVNAADAPTLAATQP